MSERGAIRLIDAGEVPAVRSQALYHGLAHARTDDTPDTIVFATSAQPYVCVGFHQDLAHEVDLGYCRAQQLPVFRRETGGGTVYVDADQLLVQWVMGPSSVPARVGPRFERFCEPIVNTYREFRIDACFRPVNDVHVDGRKISGTGAAHMGQAEVITGNFIFDFDTNICAHVLRAVSDAFRDQLIRSLDTYVTSMRRELGKRPNPRDVTARYRKQCEQTLDRALEPGTLTTDELAAIEHAGRRLLSGDFQRRPGGLKRGGLKIHEDVCVVESTNETDGVRIRVTARLNRDRIEDIAVRVYAGRIATDYSGLEDALRGIPLAPEPVARAVNGYQLRRDEPFVLSASVLTQAILDLPHQPHS